MRGKETFQFYLLKNFQRCQLTLLYFLGNDKKAYFTLKYGHLCILLLPNDKRFTQIQTTVGERETKKKRNKKREKREEREKGTEKKEQE